MSKSNSKMYTKTLAIGVIYSDFDRNFRDPVKDYLDCLPTPGFDRDKYEAGTMAAGFFEDILIHGIVKPVVVAKLSEGQRARIKGEAGIDYEYRTVQGHRRLFTAGKVNELFPGQITSVNALIYEGLSDADEWELMADHSETRRDTELSGAGLYRAVIRLHAAGFSQEKIGNMMGKAGRGFAQRHVNVFAMRLSTPVENHWLGVHLAKDDKDRPVPCYKLTNKNIDDLYPAFNADKAAGRSPMDLASQFRTEWEKITASGKSSNDVAVKAFKREDILARATFCEGRPALEEVLNFAANNGGAMDRAADLYDRLASKAAKYDEAIIANDALKSEVAGLKVTNADLTAEIDALKAEIASLKAAKIKSVK